MDLRRVYALLLAAALPLALLSQNPGDQIWFFPTGGAIVGAPSIDAAGNIVIGSEDFHVYSLAADSTVNWVASTDDLVTGNVAVSPAGPFVFGSWDGLLYGASVTGNNLWSYDTQAFISASPAVSISGMTYTGVRDGIFYALDATGQVQWFFIAKADIQAGPAIGPSGTVYFGDESGTLYALNPDGTLKWEFAADAFPDRSSRIRSTPAIDGDGDIYFGAGNHYFYALHPDGSLKWKYETQDKNDSSAAIDEEGALVFGSRDGRLYKLDSDSGSLAWLRIIGDVFYCSPAVDTENNIYIAAYVGDGVSRLYAIDAQSNVLWTRNYSGLNDSSPVLSGDGHLYIGFHDGNLYKIFAGYGPAASTWPMLARDASRRSALDEAFATAKQFGSWLNSGWFGWLSPLHGDWFYHYSHAWIVKISDDPDNLWFFDHTLQRWVWTSRQAYPVLYFPGTGWVGYVPKSYPPNRRFYLVESGEPINETELKYQPSW